MHFRDVVICDNAGCGAILRISDRADPICVELQEGLFGTFIVCPRCTQTTVIEAVESGASVRPERRASSP
jgi:hypothetical protein